MSCETVNEDAINLDCNLLAMSSTEVLRASCAPLSAQRRAQQSPWGPMARVRTAPLAHTTRLALPQVSPALTRRPLTCAPPLSSVRSGGAAYLLHPLVLCNVSDHQTRVNVGACPNAGGRAVGYA